MRCQTLARTLDNPFIINGLREILNGDCWGLSPDFVLKICTIGRRTTCAKVSSAALPPGVRLGTSLSSVPRLVGARGTGTSMLCPLNPPQNWASGAPILRHTAPCMWLDSSELTPLDPTEPPFFLTFTFSCSHRFVEPSAQSGTYRFLLSLSTELSCEVRIEQEMLA